MLVDRPMAPGKFSHRRSNTDKRIEAYSVVVGTWSIGNRRFVKSRKNQTS